MRIQQIFLCSFILIKTCRGFVGNHLRESCRVFAFKSSIESKRNKHVAPRQERSTRLASSYENSDLADFLVKSMEVDRLLELVNSTDSSIDLESSDTKEEISGLIQELDELFQTPEVNAGNSKEIFEPLLGNYRVACTLPRNKNESPAGGKWTRKNGLAQKVLNTRAQFQHLLPLRNNTPSTSAAVCQAVNVVSLSALFGLVRINVMLRGDATPLSDEERIKVAKERDTPGGLSALAVRANFDAPRIVFGQKGRFLNFSLGPKTSVVLDTTYVDDKLRLGKGSAGSRFVFVRCHPENEMANEWKDLLERKPLSKTRACTMFASGLVGGALLVRQGVKVPGIMLLATAILLGITAATSTGGIEVGRGR